MRHLLPKVLFSLSGSGRRQTLSFITTTKRTKLSTTSSSTSTLSDTASQLEDEGKTCPILQKALPELKSRFQKVANKNIDKGVFPILSPAIVEKLQTRWNPEEYDKQASVLVPVYSDNGVSSVLFTARSPYMPMNPSEISFVGGHREEGETLEETALREAQEELLGNYPWTDPEKVVILGRGTTIPAITGTPVTPIIAVMLQEIQHPLPELFPGCENEVEAVFGMSLEELLQTETSHELPNHRLLGNDRHGPLYPSPYGDIWGLTAFMLRPLLHKLYRPVFKLGQKK